jgi:hypothetical protein
MATSGKRWAAAKENVIDAKMSAARIRFIETPGKYISVKLLPD